MAKLGIGIVTYNRKDYIAELLQKIAKHTTGSYELLVADDGSSDGTTKLLDELNIRYITGSNRGVCWNKNRALIGLECLGCDPILLLEDDCYPVENGWDEHWRKASALWHHVCFAHPKLRPWISSGSGTAADPYVNQKSTAQCAAASASLLEKIGYFDTRFKGYGVGHAEWTTRAKRVGVGFKPLVLQNKKIAKANLFITGGLVANDAPTFKDRINIARNEKLFEEIKRERVYRLPWFTGEEEVALRLELKASKIDIPQALESRFREMSITA
jgi:glycosyltransferase involved in cell wall biosynthesis